MVWISFLLKKKIELLLIPCLSLYTYTQTTNMNCSYCGRNEKECEEQTELERNPITEWYVWGLSCDECYYSHHEDCDEYYYINRPEPEEDDEEEEKEVKGVCFECGEEDDEDEEFKFIIREVYITKAEYKQFITQYAPKKIDEFVENSYDDEDNFECFRIALWNSHPCYYDELWLFDGGNGYMPVLIQNINGSSPMAMWSSTLFHSNEEEINETELYNLVGKGWCKGLKKVIDKEYINRKPVDDAE